MSKEAFSERVPALLKRLDQAMDGWLPPAAQHPAPLHEAMRYACSGGKRLRPLLIYATGDVLEVPARAMDPLATAVEFTHAYSLIHDDLPAMDDDDLRRGLPTVHRKFDEATAILAGDALQTLAFHVIAADVGSGLDVTQRLNAIELLAEASGSRGMAGGQAMDLASTGKQIGVAELEAMHVHKTGALIRGCVLMACQAKSPLDTADRDALDHYGKALGLAFQIQDDILDVEGDTSELGKNAGKDNNRNKPTYPSVLGMPSAKLRAADLFDQAHASLEPLGEQAAPLHWLAEHIQGRRR